MSSISDAAKRLPGGGGYKEENTIVWTVCVVASGCDINIYNDYRRVSLSLSLSLPSLPSRLFPSLFFSVLLCSFLCFWPVKRPPGGRIGTKIRLVSGYLPTMPEGKGREGKGRKGEGREEGRRGGKGREGGRRGEKGREEGHTLKSPHKGIEVFKRLNTVFRVRTKTQHVQAETIIRRISFTSLTCKALKPFS